LAKMKIAGRTVSVPGHPGLRKTVGVLLVVGGCFGFLPILGFWMIPLGFGVLSVDMPPVRRFYRRSTVRMGYALHGRFPRAARLFGYGAPRPGKH
jgi:hypothetical protein